MTSACRYADCLKSYDNYREFNILMRLGPTLMGEKPMHVFCFNEGFKFLSEALSDFKIFFENNSKLRYLVVKSNNKSTKVIIYNIMTMNTLLSDPRIQRFLSENGLVNSDNPDVFMNLLAEKLKENIIPAEFGIFFGYPLKDVMGFIGHPSLKHVKTTAWKVYGDPRISDLIYSKFKKAEDKILDMCQSQTPLRVISMFN